MFKNLTDKAANSIIKLLFNQLAIVYKSSSTNKDRIFGETPNGRTGYFQGERK